jgi:tetratricopeptide (TPR) repeat protein
MRQPNASLLPLLLVAFPSCSSPARQGEESPARPATVAAALVASTSTSAEPLVTTEPTRVYEPDQALAPIFAGDDFRRRFAESFLAETDLEPKLVGEEGEDLTQAYQFVSTERIDEAIQLLEEKRTDASSAAVDFFLANLHFQRDDLERAEAGYRLATEKFPKFLRAWKNLASVLVQKGDFESATRAFTRVIELGGGGALQYGLLGFCHEKSQSSLAAESAYRMAILLDPATLDWRMGLVRSLYRQSRHADCAALCGELLATNPENAELWLLQANAFLGLEQPLRAAENYEIVESLGRSTPDSLNTLGDIYLNEELYAPAADAYVRALELGAEAPLDRTVRAARVLIARGALEETRRVLARVEELRGARLDEGQKKDVLKLRARLSVAEGQGEEEVRVLQEIIALDPLDGEALLLLGQHHKAKGERERAILYFEQAAALEAFEADAKIRHAQVLVEDRRYAEALPLLRRAQALKPRAHVQDFLQDVERQAQKAR